MAIFKTLSSVGLVRADAKAADFYVPDLARPQRYDALVKP